MAILSQFAEARTFARENGAYLLARRVAGAGVRRVRDRTLARRLGTTGLRMGRFPRVLGLRHIRLGRDFSAGDSLWIEALTRFAGQSYRPLITIGDRCSLSDRVHIASTNRVTLGDDVLCGSNVVITDHSHGSYSGPDQSDPMSPPNERPLSADRSVTIGSCVWIGDNVSILGGAVIGDGAVIGANSVVTGAIPAGCIAVGAPAHPIRQWHPGSREWLPV